MASARARAKTLFGHLKKPTVKVVMHAQPGGNQSQHGTSLIFILTIHDRLRLETEFYVKSSRLEIQNNSFSRLGVKLWNKIPSYITNLPKKAFKRILRKLLFDVFDWMPLDKLKKKNVLEKEDDYIEISPIIKKLGH